MTYDLHLFRRTAHADPLEAARASYEPREGDPPFVPDSGWRERMQAAAAALTEADFSLEATHLSKGTTSERIELYGPDEGTGLQILLFPDAADVHVPSWHDGADAQAAWDQAWEALRILERETGWGTYDPQLDQVLDLDADRAAVAAEYARGVEAEQAISAAPLIAAQQRPWWKFWA